MSSKLLTMIRPILAFSSSIFTSLRFESNALLIYLVVFLFGLVGCKSDNLTGIYDYKLRDGDDISYGTLKIERVEGDLSLSLIPRARVGQGVILPRRS